MGDPYSGAPTSQAPPTPFFVGLDLSLTSTGVALIHDGHATVTRITSTGRKGATTAETADRIDRIIHDILHALPPLEHCRVAVEGPSFASTGSAAHVLGGLWWAVRAHLSSVDVIVVPPSTVKKYATGKGNAGKDEVLAAVVRRYLDVEVRGNDEADALVLAAIAARLNGDPIDPALPADHFSTIATAVGR